jgi:hypothetical protein
MTTGIEPALLLDALSGHLGWVTPSSIKELRRDGRAGGSFHARAQVSRG